MLNSKICYNWTGWLHEPSNDSGSEFHLAARGKATKFQSPSALPTQRSGSRIWYQPLLHEHLLVVIWHRATGMLALLPAQQAPVKVVKVPA